MEKESIKTPKNNKEKLLDKFGFAFEEVTVGYSSNDSDEELSFQNYYLEKEPESKNILDRYFVLPSGIVLLFSAFKGNTWNISLTELGKRDDLTFLLKLEQYASELKRKSLYHTTINRRDIQGYSGFGLRRFSDSESNDLRILISEFNRRHGPCSESIDK